MVLRGDTTPLQPNRTTGYVQSESRRPSLNIYFVGLFTFLWFMGPCTQLIQIVNLAFHVRIGFSEPCIVEPEYGWYKADELAIAWADMTYLIVGALFVLGAYLRRPWCIPCGFYACSIFFFIMLMARIRWPLLEESGFGCLEGGLMVYFYLYSYVYIIFGLYGMFYLWSKKSIFDELGERKKDD